MEFILGDLFFGTIGWIYMFLKHRDFTQMRIEIKAKYENQYSSVGREITSNAFLIILAIVILSLIIVAVYVSIFKR